MIESVLLIYMACLSLGYVALFISGAVQLLRVYRQLIGLPPEAARLRSDATLPISIIAPAHNEELTVVQSVRSLLNLRYPNHQVIVVNDGSTDKTLQTLKDAFELEEIPLDIRMELPCKPLRGVFRSTKDTRLLVIDKENGGKADALNAGINAARFPLVCSIDADTLVVPDALLRMVRLFLNDPKVLAAGGTVRVANGCTIDRGHVMKVGLPTSFLARFQVVEYLRAFWLGRLGWEQLGGNLIVSGAFGMFRRAALVAVGGYQADTVGEDMELVVRLRSMAARKDQKRAVVHLPDPVCFTEVPESIRALGKQRDRWQRGLMDTLWRHRDMAFDSKFGAIGLFVIPFFFLFELLGPAIELFGYLFLIYNFIAGTLNPVFALLFLGCSLLFGFFLSAGAVLLEEQSFSLYRSTRDLLWLMLIGLIENLGYRQAILWFRVQGIVSFLLGRKRWGKMKRAGFGARRGTKLVRNVALAVILLLVLGAPPLYWWLKPTPNARVVVLDKTVPFDDYRGHLWLTWLLTEGKAPTPDGRLAWVPARDYVGYQPRGDMGTLLTPSALARGNLLYIADTYGVYEGDLARRGDRLTALEPSPRVFGGVEASEMDAIETFAAGGGRVIAEFNTFASPTTADVRQRMERLLGVHWTGWIGRYLAELSNTKEVAEWVRQAWMRRSGRVWDLSGPAVLLIHEDGRVVILRVGHEIGPDPVQLHGLGVDVPYTFWFDVVEPSVASNVRATFSLEATGEGAEILKREGIPSSFPALVRDDGFTRGYLAGDFADGQAWLGPPWLAWLPPVRQALARVGVLPDQMRVLWAFYTPFVQQLLQSGGTQPNL
jgi:cellulose synthase/poly-beta-1,6-N-acetylglucosamine synthase-like glycosyltransferase